MTALLVKIPCCIVTEVSDSVEEVMNGLARGLRLVNADFIVNALLIQMSAAHEKGRVLGCCLSRKNLVRLSDGRGWAMRELSNCTRENKPIRAWRHPADILLIPPEVCAVAAVAS